MARSISQYWSNRLCFVGSHPIDAVYWLYSHDLGVGSDVEVEFNYQSSRANKARAGKIIGKHGYVACIALALALMLFGVGLLALESSLGWFIASLAAYPIFLAKWYNGELKDVPMEPSESVVDAVLSSAIVAQLPMQPSPSDIANAVGLTNDGLFFGVRFGLTPNFLKQISSQEQSDTREVWRVAMELRDSMDMPGLSAGILIYALVKQFSDHEAMLAHNHIDLGDIKQGILWQDHLNKLIEKHTRPKRTGGIARDWSFGFTPLIARFGQNISQQIAAGGSLNIDLETHQDALDQLIDTFSSRGKQNVMLVGEPGVGKTTIVEAFAEKLLDASSKLPKSLKFRQVVLLDSASLISAAPGRGELEDLIMKIFGEAFAAKNIIVCLDDAQLFFEEGVGSVDLSNVLLPILNAGRLRIILTMDEQRYLQISQRNAALASTLNRINIQPASKEETLLVLQDKLIVTEFERKVTYTYQSLAEAYRLSERYIHDLAMPGRALKLLESAAGYSEKGLVTMNSVQQAIEKTMNVKVSIAADSSERETLLNLEELIHKRMINQKRAVEVVSDALRRARAGVRNQNRPIGTFLFLGPTGVGKTELSKALADVYFGGEGNIIRLDMNEYVRNEDVVRLIADGSDDPSSLTAQAMKQPFSVVLLDEIEKAHPNVLTTLLQMLDEGILRDIKNREVSFRDAIVIATSNAGAERIREYIERGYKLQQFEEELTNELISSGEFKPEFLNRFDDIVLFTPLEKNELLKVVDLMIEDVNKTLALQKVTVVVEKKAKELLVEKGYDPRLGARPMRRVIQRVVENNVAKAMLSGVVTPGMTITVLASQVEDSMNTHGKAEAISASAKSD